MILAQEDVEAALRLGAAIAIGVLIGLNRDLKGKPLGMRTLGLVALGAAVAALAAIRVEGMAGNADATSRIVQGILQGVLTGIGFVGAGVVLRDPRALEVHGLTTAASVWVTAALGIACALGSWHLIFMGGAAALFLLVVVHRLERFLEFAGRGQDASSHEDGSER